MEPPPASVYKAREFGAGPDRAPCRNRVDTRQALFDVAGDPDNGAGVDMQTCKTREAGFRQLCTAWQDPEFDAAVPAVYYLRAVENPTCRYSARQCPELPAAQRPRDCAEPFFDPVIQERAWSSPIWYSPPGRSVAMFP